jgi:hypothetical protein
LIATSRAYLSLSLIHKRVLYCEVFNKIHTENDLKAAPLVCRYITDSIEFSYKAVDLVYINNLSQIKYLLYAGTNNDSNEM